MIEDYTIRLEDKVGWTYEAILTINLSSS